MSTGKRYKFQGSHISILTGFTDEDSPPLAITGITQANPPVVTAAGHGLDDGDIIMITDVVGMVDVNDVAFIVDGVTSSTFKLFGADSTGYAAYTSGGVIDVGAWSEFCELTGWNRTGSSKTQIDASTVCSTEEEYEVGLPGQGTVALAFNFAPLTSTAQVALRAWDLSGDMMATKLQLPKNGGTMTQFGFVQKMSESGATKGIWTASADILNTGERYDLAAT